MLRVEQHGSLAVAWNTTDERAVNRELQRLSSTLFLDPECDPDVGVYWTVKDAKVTPPVCVLVWRADNGEAMPLTLGIVEQVKRQHGQMDGAVREMIDRERQRRDREHAAAADRLAEIREQHAARIRAAELDSLPPFWRPRRFGRGA